MTGLLADVEAQQLRLHQQYLDAQSASVALLKVCQAPTSVTATSVDSLSTSTDGICSLSSPAGARAPCTPLEAHPHCCVQAQHMAAGQAASTDQTHDHLCVRPETLLH